MSYLRLIWLFPVVTALHNLEEAIWFPAWATRTSRWHAQFSPGAFRFAVFVLTVLAFAVTWMSVRSGRQSFWTYLAFGYAAAVLANAFLPHIAMTLAGRAYMPGFWTALLLIVPVLSWLVVLALRQGYVSGGKAAAYAACTAVVLLASIPALFYLGKALRS
jgi:hypothetical protein